MAASLFIGGCEPTAPSPSPVLEIIGVDQSLSAKELRPFDTASIRQLIVSHFEKGEAVTVAVGAIREPSDKQLLIEHFDAPSAIDEYTAPSIRDKQRATAAKVRETNNRRLSTYLQRLQKEIFSDPANAVETDINGFLAKAETMLEEGTFRGEYVRRVILLTDCKQDTGNAPGDTIERRFRQSPPFTLMLVGCKDAKPFQHVNVERFQSIESLLLFLQKPSSTN